MKIYVGFAACQGPRAPVPGLSAENPVRYSRPVMLTVLESISPVFFVIGLGFFSRRLGFLPDHFISSANRLVYYIAIPILVYKEIAQAPLRESFDPLQIGGTFLAVGLVAAAALALARALGMARGLSATLAQCSFHGNLGYVGLAVVFYVLGPGERGSASVLAGFLILFQNALAIGLFTVLAPGGHPFGLRSAGRFLGNPVILGTALGLFSSASGLELPSFILRSFDIVGDMALPLALFIIGGSLSTRHGRSLGFAGISTVLKTVLLPLVGLAVFRITGLAPSPTAAAVILLASPSATVTYVVASEMGGEPDLAAAAVTVSTCLSILTYTLWIAAMGG